MSKKDNLYELIHSLTKSEKRAFKINTAFYKGNKLYTQLFDIIEGQEKYNEKEVRALIKSVSFVNNLPRNKNYLYNLILKFLTEYDDGDLDKLFYNLMKQAKTLYKRGLYDQAEQLTERIRSKTKIIEREKFELNVCLILWEHLLDNRKYNRTLEKYVSDNELIGIKFSLHFIHEFINLESNYNKVLRPIVSKGWFNITEKEKKEINNLVKSHIYSNPEKGNSIRIKSMLYLLHFVNSFYWDNDVELRKNAKKYLTFIDKGKATFFINDLSVYSSMINTIGVLCTSRKIFDVLDDIESNLDYILSFVKSNKINLTNFEEALIYVRVFNLKIAVSVNQNKFTEVIPFLKTHEASFLNKINSLNKRSVWNSLSDLREVYQFAGFYQDAFRINCLYQSITLNDDKINSHINSKITLMILCIEIKEMLMFESLHRSLKRTLLKEKSLPKSYIIILNYLKIISSNEKINKKNIYEAFKKELLTISKIKEEQIVFKHFNYIVWIESKIKNTTMAEIKRG